MLTVFHMMIDVADKRYVDRIGLEIGPFICTPACANVHHCYPCGTLPITFARQSAPTLGQAAEALTG